MVDTLSALQSGIVTLGRKFSDGSLVTFQATASPTILSAKGLDTSEVYDLTNMKIIPKDKIETEYTIIEKETSITKLDKYLNRGVKDEYDKIG